MRVKRDFAERKKTKSSRDMAKKFFLVFEGTETEVQYFTGIERFKHKLGIGPLIEIRPLLRSYEERGWSNPKKILDRLIHFIEENNTGILLLESFISKVVDYLIEDAVMERSVFQPDDIREMLFEYFEEEYGLCEFDPISDPVALTEGVSICLAKKANLKNSVRNLNRYLKDQNITYEEGFDKICLIVDRDKYSFVSHPLNDQYDYVRNKCREKGYEFFLTNPCFEFWLLLHFDEVFELDFKLLKENPKITSKRRYAEEELRKVLPGYHKSSIKFDKLVGRVQKAVCNEKHFCETIDELREQIGSNLGLLITMMQKEGKNLV